MKVLVVQSEFSLQPAPVEGEAPADPKGYVRGQIVKDPAEQNAILTAGHGHRCTATDVADEFFAEDKPAKAPKASA